MCDFIGELMDHHQVHSRSCVFVRIAKYKFSILFSGEAITINQYVTLIYVEL